MKSQITIFLFFSMIFFLSDLKAQESLPPVKNDSITLAQAFINLTLTKEYFEGLSEDRVGKILPFEIEELESIIDHTFLKDNAGLYNFTLSLLYYNQAKFLFRTQKSPHRRELIEWKVALEKAMNYFNLAKSASSRYQENPFFTLINYTKASYSTLHQELFILKSLFTPYFNEDIYPDYKRIFLKAKNSDRYEIDSLAYFAGLYELEFTSLIIDKEYESYNYDFGPNTLPLISEYTHFERDYDYHPYTDPIKTAYLLDEKLDLISRYVQLKSLASIRNTDKLSWFESYRIYNDYYIFEDASLDKFFINKITKIEDPFLKTELDSKELDVLYAGLRKNFSYASYATAQAFINLSLIQDNFESQSNSQIASILSFHEGELNEIMDSFFIEQNSQLYNFTHSLLYKNTSKLLFRSRKNIDRKTLFNWKVTLEKGIEYFNISQQVKEKTAESFQFNEHIKFDGNDQVHLKLNINKLKDDFTPYFNEDVYVDFQRIFYKAKNLEEYDFDSLKAFAEIYNLSIDLSILKNRESQLDEEYFNEISKEYEILRKLDLISRYLQFKYLASDKFTIPSNGFNIDQLYKSYNQFIYQLETEKDEFILRELNEETIEILLSQLQDKFPYNNIQRSPAGIIDSDADGVEDFQESESSASQEYLFFPELAPLASASFIQRNFKPELKSLGNVNDFLLKEFISAGYKNELHYYYASDGFALTTSLEKFNIDGSTVPADKRFVKSMTEKEKLSYYEIFKSMFFEVKSDFRMFAMVIASNATNMSRNGMTPSFAEKLIEESYEELPANLKNKKLSNKTLSIFVYHFHINDIGGTVELDLSGKTSANDHLKKAGLFKIIQ